MVFVGQWVADSEAPQLGGVSLGALADCREVTEFVAVAAGFPRRGTVLSAVRGLPTIVALLC